MSAGHNFIAGQWVPARSGATFTRTNPADPTDVIGTFADSGPADVADAVDAEGACDMADLVDLVMQAIAGA